VNQNIFAAKEEVYLDGGPITENASGLPDGLYYVQVTEPDGTVLGKSIDAPFEVVGGSVVQCYQLSAILVTKSSNFTAAGYDDSTNGGGVYKVWISPESTFPNSNSKTDNFKVEEDGTGTTPEAELEIVKFYDANVNGTWDLDEPEIILWKVRISQVEPPFELIRYTRVLQVLDPGFYNVEELFPVEPNWVATTATSFAIELIDSEFETVEFGNVCLGDGGGHTLGFWSNRNGAALFGDDDLAAMVALNLRDGSGNPFDPADHATFKTWILGANAKNMAYMISAQLAAMKLNVLNGFVDDDALIYGGVALGFMTVNELITAANNALANPVVEDADYLEQLKDALDDGNNNMNFVQTEPCDFTFPDPQALIVQ
jgi:hypothetical protein